MALSRTLQRCWCWATLLLLLTCVLRATAERVRELEVSEGAPVGTVVGFIGDEGAAAGAPGGPPYLIVPVPGSAVDSDLAVEHTSGEIRTRVPLDRETRASYSLVAIPLSGENVRVVVRVLDENDNAPVFPAPSMRIEFPENTPRDVKRTLAPARDLDLGPFNTQRYNIVSGNVDDAFRLSSHRERDGVLYLDLQINGFLDRETTASYSLVIEALDGGSPPMRGVMSVEIAVQDVNDNQPVFNQSRYFATVPENATVGTAVLQVCATDADAGENGHVAYAVNRRQSDRENMFRIDAASGLVAVNRPLDFEAKEVHELVVVARDGGPQPLETTAFVSIRVTDVNDNEPSISVIFLSDDATPKISEAARPGEFVARISVHDPDSRAPYANPNVTLQGGDGRFGLATRDEIIYLVIVSLPLDREQQPDYTLSVIATDAGTPPLNASKTFRLRVTDVNDNAPEFERSVFHANVLEVADPGTSVFQIHAIDRDEGNNSALVYSIRDTPETHSAWFQIDARSGLITTRAHVDCETDPVPALTVVARDAGPEPLSSSATVFVTIHDVNDNEPIFDQSFYNVSVAESEPRGRCVLKVSATDPDCGVNAMVNYTLGEGFGKVRDFEVRAASGEVCIAGDLDFETRSVYEFPVIATDRGGLSTTAMVKIQLTDVNDNRPTFYPREYNVSLREGGAGAGEAPVVVLAATDADSGTFGAVTFAIAAGNDAGLFRVDASTGEIFVTRPAQLSTRRAPYHRLNVSAVDGGGRRALQDAEVFLSVTDAAQRPPLFQRTRYTFAVREDASAGTAVGGVKATAAGSAGVGVSDGAAVRYSIYSGDPDGYFRIDASTGAISTARALDHEAHASVLLNVQATSGAPPAYGHSQVHIGIEDVNDNAPEFDSPTVRISVPENVELGVPLYAAHARDRDSGRNGVVRYRLAAGDSGGGGSGLFAVDATSGHLTLARHLDYEAAQRHSLVVAATDAGAPPLSATLSVLVEVQDVNDNPPVFERPEYAVDVLESLPVNSQVLQVTAVDLDTGNNARLTYRLVSGSGGGSDGDEPEFGVFPNSGVLYLRRALDRETRARYALTVAATDNGSPAATATARVLVSVLDANDNDPRFARDAYSFSVQENLGAGARVGRVVATDADSGANAALRYALLPANGSFLVDPDTGDITTREPLDRETRAAYELVAEARDGGEPPRSTRVSVAVAVTDVNDNAPEIVDPQEEMISVREDQPPGTEVVRVRAVDRDSGANASVTYSLLAAGSDADAPTAFAIDAANGLVRTRAVLDHEERAVWRLAVAATDAGVPPRRSTRVLRVEVLDLANNRPTFTSYSLVFRVREDAPVGFVVGSVAASEGDTDPDGRVAYSLSPLAGGVSAFEVERSTGALVVARPLDREVRAQYRLEVRALDTTAHDNPQSASASVRVDIADVNDNPPQWARDPLLLTLAEDVAVGVNVWNFSASDADSGSNGELRYSLEEVAGTPTTDRERPFALDPLTGALTLSTPLDFETRREYVLVVMAADQASNHSERLSTALTALVRVTDANDHAPEFVWPAAGGVALSDAAPVGTTVCVLLARDGDAGANGRVAYALAPGDTGGQFELDAATGILTLARPLAPASAALRRFTLNVTATDNGEPARAAWRELVVDVRGAKERPPRFSKREWKANVSEDAPLGALVARVQAPSQLPGGGGNVTYSIPAGVAGDRFVVDARSGAVTLRAALDREEQDSYAVPVYATEAAAAAASTPGGAAGTVGALFDVATMRVMVLDANDHAPAFGGGACDPLALPENSDAAVVRTVVAHDPDDGANGRLSYAISAGNVGNKFSLDARSGALTAAPLDREATPRFVLTLTATDAGAPARSTACNVTVAVEDANDNAPRFSAPRYAAAVPEDAQPGTAVLTVRAVDADLGANARVSYALANESHWLFRVDAATGVISTVGTFDFERQSVYRFAVVATDGARADARSNRVPVQVSVTDVNDNAPTFARFPFAVEVPAYAQPGSQLLRVEARDADQGANAEVVYSLLPATATATAGARFRLNPSSGVVTAASSLAADAGRVFQLGVLARDRGNPPRSTRGLVEIRVTAGSDDAGAPRLAFHNASYTARLPENAPAGRRVTQVAAVRSDGRRQHVTYSLGGGGWGASEGTDADADAEAAFAIDPLSGVVTVRQPRLLDFERAPRMRMVVAARTEAEAEGAGAESTPLFGYAELLVQLEDENDNAPRFTQPQYAATVWEGRGKGSFVIQVSATDADEDANARVLYHIVDGNHDNAFVIEPPASGLVKTNIVLDREIRDAYRLTVIATDEGRPQLTGTATLRVSVVDANDNQPTFPPHSAITVSEGTEVGAVLTVVTANDVDTQPALTYSFVEEVSSAGAANVFALDRFSGRLTLVRPLDFEKRSEYRLRVTASDSLHAAHTVLTVRVADENDNAPRFSQPAYQATLPERSGTGDAGAALLTVSATDADSGANARVRYSLAKTVRGFSVDHVTGAVFANCSGIAAGTRVAELLVVATDGGTPPRRATAAVRVRVGDTAAGVGPRFARDEYRVHVREDALAGTTVVRVGADPTLDDPRASFTILEGNDDGAFQVMSPGGDVVLVGSLDRESRTTYSLAIAAGDGAAAADNTSVVTVLVTVDDANDHAPVFEDGDYDAELSEAAPPGTEVLRVSASDADQPGTPNAQVTFAVTSGDDRRLFVLDARSGALRVRGALDYDAGPTEFALVVLATDNARSPDTPLRTSTTVRVRLRDENDHAPRFPVAEYAATVGENEPTGAAVLAATASDLDRGPFGRLNYSLAPAPGAPDAWRLFRVDSATGAVHTDAIFDYEARSHYSFTLRVADAGGLSASARVRVDVESRDEFAPAFAERAYRFAVRGSRLPVGHEVGRVTATDRDAGPDGRVVYQLSAPHALFKINRTTGALLLRKKLDAATAGGDVSLVVVASSGRQGSLAAKAAVEVALDGVARGGNRAAAAAGGGALAAAGGGLADWALGLLIALALVLLALGAGFLFLRARHRRQKKVNKPALGGGASVGDAFADAASFDTVPVRGGAAPAQAPGAPFAPPKYDEIPPYVGGPVVHRNNNSSSSNSGAATTSELSGSEQSGSSGRGSAEDGEDVEDEEIRMINEGPLQRDSGIHRQADDADDDDLSDVSVHNTQEYLARLGIVDAGGGGAGASRRCSDALGAAAAAAAAKDALLAPPLDTLHLFDEDAGGEPDLTSLIYAKLGAGANGGGSERGEDASTLGAGALGAAVDRVMGLGAFDQGPGLAHGSTHQPSMTGSLSSIVHSEEELTGSYNWDYLLDWGPQYQPLAHVFSEIARLKDDTASVQSTTSGASSGKGGGVGGSGGAAKALGAPHAPAAVKTVPPPLLTSVAPRSLAAPVLAPRSAAAAAAAAAAASAAAHPASHHGGAHALHTHGGAGAGAGAAPQLLLLPRSPISHDATGAGFGTSAAMSPSFSPSLSPLATRSPSISPLVTPGAPGAHHVVSLPRPPHAQAQAAQAAQAAAQAQRAPTAPDGELRI